MMSNKIFPLAVVAVAVMVFTAAKEKDGAITLQGDTVVVNTTTLARGVIGYQDATPVKIYIHHDVVQRVEALPCQETPKFFQAACRKVLPQWQGLSVDAALEQPIDGRTGATLSSDALIKNVRKGLDRYRSER